MLLLSTAAQGASDASMASVGSLKWPLVNFVILFGFIIWKVRKPLREFFTKNHHEIQGRYTLAQEKEMEAKIKLEMYQKKVDEVEEECERILRVANSKGQLFADEYRKEILLREKKMREDGIRKIEGEKGQILGKLRNTLVETIVNLTKKKFDRDNHMKRKINQRLLELLKNL